jgi:hypothetical protein
MRGDVMNGWKGSLAERPFASPIDFVCECAQVDCVEQILLTVSEYEALRREPERFAVSSGHDNPDVDRVVAEGERYVVVDRLERAGFLVRDGRSYRLKIKPEAVFAP